MLSLGVLIFCFGVQDEVWMVFFFESREFGFEDGGAFLFSLSLVVSLLVESVLLDFEFRFELAVILAWCWAFFRREKTRATLCSASKCDKSHFDPDLLAFSPRFDFSFHLLPHQILRICIVNCHVLSHV